MDRKTSGSYFFEHRESDECGRGCVALTCVCAADSGIARRLEPVGDVKLEGLELLLVAELPQHRVDARWGLLLRTETRSCVRKASEEQGAGVEKG